MQKYSFLLAFIVFVFFIKGLFLSAIFPIFQQPDEQVHYATIQHRAESAEKYWPIEQKPQESARGDNIATYHFSEEITRTAQATRFDEVKWQNTNIQEFETGSSLGSKEEEILTAGWKRYMDTYPILISGTTSSYYTIATLIERHFSDESILFRFFSLRIFSTLLGCGVVLLSYFIAQNVGFSKQHSLLLTGIIAFQPMFSTTASMVNIDIMLVLAFSAYLYGATLALHSRFSKKAWVITIISMMMGIFSKGPGLVLVPSTIILLICAAYPKFARNPKHLLKKATLISGIILFSGYIFLPHTYISNILGVGSKSAFSSPVVSLTKYFDKTLTSGSISDTVASYWGNFGWLDTKISSTILNGIKYIELLSFAVIVYLLIFRKIALPKYLPTRRYILLLFGMIIVLQLAIRFYDWRVFDTSTQIAIGTPGRYFLPNIIAHIILITTGLGFLLKTEPRFNALLKAIFVSMVLLTFYSILDIIIPRYYL